MTDEKPKTQENYIFIGSKPIMSYVTGVLIQFNTNNAPEVTIKSRGKFISRAVDVAEVARRKFPDLNIQIKDIKVASEEFENKEGRDINVSTMEIILVKG